MSMEPFLPQSTASGWLSAFHFHTCQYWNHSHLAVSVCLFEIDYSIFDFFCSKCFDSSFLGNLFDSKGNSSLTEFSFDKYFGYHWFTKGICFQAYVNKNRFIFHFCSFNSMNFWFIDYLMYYFVHFEFFEDSVQFIVMIIFFSHSSKK